MTFAVVIPYFQKTEGLLSQALASIAAQRACPTPRVVIVDDGSPVPARVEVARFGGAGNLAIDVVEQRNAGPSAARNRGLDALPADVTRVAFLDADHVWTEDHLMHAHHALDAGFDVFFSNRDLPGQEVVGSARAGRIPPEEHPAVGDTELFHSFEGNMYDQLIHGDGLGTSTVVYAYERFRLQRFDEAFHSAGAGSLFLIALARAGARFASSYEAEAHLGLGVDVHAGSGWGTPGFMRRIQNEMRYRKRLLDFDLSDPQRGFVKDAIAKLRVEFAGDFVHRVTHRQPLPMDLLKTQLKLDAMTLLALPHNAGQLVARQIKGARARR